VAFYRVDGSPIRFVVLASICIAAFGRISAPPPERRGGAAKLAGEWDGLREAGVKEVVAWASDWEKVAQKFDQIADSIGQWLDSIF
jgi:hypothetical protein